jgi:CDP-6-deoxy-D-xylo-4-hexulose-3-dehydrase
MKVPYATVVYGGAEKAAVTRVLQNPRRLTAGYAVKELESRISKLVGKQFGVMVNSGSSANLIAIEVLGLPVGSEVITPALTFATTVAPLLQKGLKPVLVDVDDCYYTANIKQIEAAITPRTRALLIPSLIGNLPDLARLQRIAEKHKLYFIEDSCDTLGAYFRGKPSGVYSHITTTSFYASHIITAAGSGGMACFRLAEHAQRALILSNWGRASTLFGVYEKSEELKKRFSERLDGDPYDAKFLFTEIGYNFQPIELCAAFALEQLKKLDAFRRRRKNNFNRLQKVFARYQQYFVLPQEHPLADTAWLAFPLQVREAARFSRYELCQYLERHGIQTRPIFTGNISRQPAFARAFSRLKIPPGSHPISNRVMKSGFLIGCHQGMTMAHIEYLKKVFDRFLLRRGTDT